MEVVKTTEEYKVHLEAFEGPMDLLLYLIKKEDIDIYDIPVAKLLEQYLEYLSLARELNIDLAGEFVELASELTFIKSKMLLPEPEAEEEEGPDPRADLVARLMEYQRFKAAGQSLVQRPMLDRDVFRRPPTEEQNDPQGETLMQADLASLLNAFQDLLKRLPSDKVHEIRDKGLGVAEKMLELMEVLRGKEQIAFEDLFEKDITRSDFVVTFLSILQMAKQGLVKILQERVLHKLYICPLITENSKVVMEDEDQGEKNGS